MDASACRNPRRSDFYTFKENDDDKGVQNILFCACMREWMVVEEKKKIVEEKRSWSKKSEWDKKQKTLLKGMGLQASRPGTRIEGSRIPKILEK